MNRFFLILLFVFLFNTESNLYAQTTRKVLFLGNSYTAVNDLPQIVHDVAISAGDTLIFDSNAPGGYHIHDHDTDAISLNKIMNGGWDYVIIQGQSQEPILSFGQFSSSGLYFNNLVKQYNPCAVTMPYMTWGRKNGDATTVPWFPETCTYELMNEALTDSYIDLAVEINGEVSPVAVVWNYIRQNYPNIELYQPDESHPSTAGSYVAACCFYSSVFKKDPTFITYNFGINATDAAIIRDAVKIQVFDSLQLWDFKKAPVTDLRYQIGPGINEVNFNAISHGVRQIYLWDFGDGDTSSAINPTHFYLNNGTYTVTLTTTTCDLQGLHISQVDTVIQFCNHTPTIYSLQPLLCRADTLWTQAADTYQWFSYGFPIPETNQYLTDYTRYANSGFTVISSVNDCAELSGIFNDSPLLSDFYFDLISFGDPCIGDTIPFAVLHQSGSIPASANILWFKNDTLLPLVTNDDTLFISAGGLYACKVIDPGSLCPLDTTSYEFEFDCDITSLVKTEAKTLWNLYPNPASETITLELSKNSSQETIQIYSAIGSLVRYIYTSGSKIEINIADLADGMYFIKLKNNKQSPLKFIKQ